MGMDPITDQFVPPSVVLRTVPEFPTAQAAVALKPKTEFNCCAVPLVCAVQVESPLIDFNTVPESPTAHAAVVLKTWIPRKERLVGLPDQFAPVFTVFKMVPELPTAKAVAALK